MKSKSLKYTCLFGGGAIRGAAYVGTLQALQEMGIKPTTIAGSSVGAIVATFFALGYTAEEVKNIFLDVNFDLFKDLQFGLGANFALSKGEVFLEWIRDLVEQKFYGESYEKGKNKPVTFKDIDKNLVIITTDLTNFTCNEFSKFATPDYEIATAVRISCTMPGLMKPLEYENKVLVDGDLQKSMPMWKLSPNLLPKDERVIEFRLEGEKYSDDKNAIQFMNTVYSCITSICTGYIAELYGNKDEFDYVTINTGDVIVVDFNCPKEKREELMQSGYTQTMNYFKNVLPEKKEHLLELYYSIEKSLKKIQKYIKNHRVVKAKYTLGDLFMELSEHMNIIDTNILDKIQRFKRIFNNNIKYPALFGNVKLKDYVVVDEVLDEIIKQNSEKIYELEEYIIKFSH